VNTFYNNLDPTRSLEIRQNFKKKTFIFDLIEQEIILKVGDVYFGMFDFNYGGSFAHNALVNIVNFIASTLREHLCSPRFLVTVQTNVTSSQSKCA
jgi:hypothetical protein